MAGSFYKTWFGLTHFLQAIFRLSQTFIWVICGFGLVSVGGGRIGCGAVKNALSRCILGLLALAGVARGNSFPMASGAEAQPLLVQVQRLEQAVQYSGRPFV